MDEAEYLKLTWNSYSQNFKEVFRELRQTECLSDVTLVCGDDRIQAHKLVLIGNSSVFKSMLLQSKGDTVVYLRGVSKSEMDWALEFMYLGETQLPQSHLEKFLNLAKEFKMNGLLEREGTSTMTEMKKAEVKTNTVVIKSTFHTAGIQVKTEYAEDKESVETSDVASSVNSYEEVIDGSFETVHLERKERNNSIFKRSPKVEHVNFKQKFYCDKCDYFTICKDNLKLHVDREHIGIRYPCDFCPYRAGSSKNLKDHQAGKHKIDPRFRCKLCDFCTNHTLTKNKHVSTHPSFKDQDIFESSYINNMKVKY